MEAILILCAIDFKLYVQSFNWKFPQDNVYDNIVMCYEDFLYSFQCQNLSYVMQSFSLDILFLNCNFVLKLR